MTEYKTLHDIIWSIPPKLTRPTQRKDVFGYHQPYLNIYDVLTDGGNRVQFVDLGLPSGILWADRNLGASSPEDFGDGYAGGEVKTKTTFTWDNYKYGTANTLTKYCNDSSKGLNGYTDALTELEDADDAIQVNSTGYMPNSEQVQELIENTTQEGTTLNGVPGVKFTGQNGNSIFIPATINDESGFIWSTSLNESDADQAYGLSFVEDQVTLDLEDRYTGQSVRARGVISKTGRYLTIEATSDNTKISLTVGDADFEGRKNSRGGTTATDSEIYLNSGDIVEFRGNTEEYDGSNIRTTGGSAIVYGNIMSLIDSDNFDDLTTFPEDSTYNFCGLFKNSTSITSASGLTLPVMTLTQGCYQNLFMGCTSLTQTPVISATVMVQSCYEGMFEGCYSLTTAPNMPANNTAKYCYKRMYANCSSLRNNIPASLPGNVACYGCFYQMFINCTSLTTAPVLPATEIHGSAYFEMFQECISLTTAPTLPATVLTSGPEDEGEETSGITQYFGMFWNCSNLTTAPTILPATGPLPGSCYSHMFQGCTSLTTAPILPAENKGSFAYGEMFRGCSNLNYVKCLATDDGNARDWLNGVSETGTFVKNPNTTGSSGASGIPSGGTIVDAT